MVLPDTLTFERAGLDAWPGIEVEWDGGWVRRAAGGYTKRANSVQSLNPADDDNAEARIAGAVDWFKARGLPPVFRVTPLTGPRTRAALDDLGWSSYDASHLYAMSLGEHEPDDEGVLLDLVDPQFLAAQQALQGYDNARLARMQALLAVMAVPAAGIVVHRGGRPAASGLMAIANGIVITGNVITDGTLRRQGLGAAMMRTGLAWASGQGATVAALNVQADNPAGQALYASLGYTHQYDYAYRSPVAA